MKLPNLGWMTLRWMPICPSPAATATGLCETTQVLPGKRSVSIGKPTDGLTARTPRFDSRGDDPPRGLVGVVVGVVELQVGDRAGGAADRLPVHPADDADQRPGPRVERQDVGPLVVELGPADRDEPHVVGAELEAEPAKLGGVQGRRARSSFASWR